ncbi:MAG TPA: hypothetical protein VJB02_02935 [Coxiellaceae bacterium]|nr:hypothetical protein [Coxiellaceae bacterium]
MSRGQQSILDRAPPGAIQALLAEGSPFLSEAELRILLDEGYVPRWVERWETGKRVRLKRGVNYITRDPSFLRKLVSPCRVEEETVQYPYCSPIACKQAFQWISDLFQIASAPFPLSENKVLPPPRSRSVEDDNEESISSEDSKSVEADEEESIPASLVQALLGEYLRFSLQAKNLTRVPSTRSLWEENYLIKPSLRQPVARSTLSQPPLQTMIDTLNVIVIVFLLLAVIFLVFCLNKKPLFFTRMPGEILTAVSFFVAIFAAYVTYRIDDATKEETPRKTPSLHS